MCEPTTIAAIGLAANVGGSLLQGALGSAAANEQAALVAEQKENEKALFATQELRTRRNFDIAIAEQASQITAAGFQGDSPTALLLARDAAAEKIFEAQSVRSFGAAKAAELTATEKSLRAQAQGAMLGGVIGAAGALVTGAPKVWPGLLA